MLASMTRARRTGGLPAIDIEDADVVEVVLGPFGHHPARGSSRRSWPALGGAFALGLTGGLLLAHVAVRGVGPTASPTTTTAVTAAPATTAPERAVPTGPSAGEDYAGAALAQFIAAQRSLPQRGRDSRPSHDGRESQLAQP